MNMYRNPLERRLDWGDVMCDDPSTKAIKRP